MGLMTVRKEIYNERKEREACWRVNVRMPRMLAEIITLDGWRNSACSETHVWTRWKCRQTTTSSVMYRIHKQNVSAKLWRYSLNSSHHGDGMLAKTRAIEFTIRTATVSLECMMTREWREEVSKTKTCKNNFQNLQSKDKSKSLGDIVSEDALPTPQPPHVEHSPSGPVICDVSSPWPAAPRSAPCQGTICRPRLPQGRVTLFCVSSCEFREPTFFLFS